MRGQEIAAAKNYAPTTLGAGLQTTRTVLGGLSQCSVRVVVLGAISSSHWQAGSLGEAASARRPAADVEAPSREALLALRPLAAEELCLMPLFAAEPAMPSPESSLAPLAAEALCRMPPPAFAATPSPETGTGASRAFGGRSAVGPETSAEGPAKAGRCVQEEEGVSDGVMCGDP